MSVATLSEAEALARAGADDLFIAYPLWLDKAKAGRARALADEVALRVGVDSVEGRGGWGKRCGGATARSRR